MRKRLSGTRASTLLSKGEQNMVMKERTAVVFLLAVSAGCSAAMQLATTTGVVGTVMVSPARPGPQRQGARDSRAYAGAVVLLRDAQGRTLGRAVADEQGHFSLHAPVGEYQLEVDVQGAAYPRCEPTSLQIYPAVVSRVELHCDSGMR